MQTGLPPDLIKAAESVLSERELTPAEMKKREEIVKALKRDGMDKDKAYAIATAQAKKAVQSIDEDFVMTVKPKQGDAERFWYRDKSAAEKFKKYLEKDPEFKDAKITISSGTNKSKIYVGDKLAAKAKGLREGVELNEAKMIDGEKFIQMANSDKNFAREVSSAYNAMVFLRNQKFKAKIDPKTLKGEAIYRGIKIKFEMGNENFYIELPSLFVKDGKKDMVDAIRKLLDVVNNYGGAGK